MLPAVFKQKQAQRTRKPDMKETIRTKLDDLRGILQADGGDMEIVSIEDKTVKLKLKGACGGCPHAAVTLKQGIERVLRDEIDPGITVERIG
jgi:Fe-S cluster biogenesis protein NfuA